MRIVSFTVLTLILFSCGNNQHTDNKSGESKAEKSDSLNKKDTVAEKDTVIIDAGLSFEEKAKKLKEKYLSGYTEIESDESILPERFEYKWKMKFFCSNPTMEFYFFEYADTSGKQNVINNWYNCFGKDCITIKENETAKGFKSGYFFSIVNEQEIIYFGYECEGNEKTIQEIIRELKLLFGSKKSKYSGIYCNGVLNWK